MVFSGSSGRLWSTYASFTVSPILISPTSGFSCPVIIRNSVVLPAPLGPMTPIMPPWGREKFISSQRRLSPYAFETLCASIATSPSRGPEGINISSSLSRISDSSASIFSYAAMRALLFAWRPFGFMRTHSNSSDNAFCRFDSCFSSSLSRWCFCSSHEE